MAITYEGDDAHERWKSDLKSFANVREANSWQLYAFTHSISPSLIFHQEMIPFNLVWMRASDAVRSYIDWRFHADSDALIIAKQRYCQSLLNSSLLPVEEIWIDPSNGTFCWGPPCYIYAIQQYFQHVIEENVDNFLKPYSLMANYISIDLFTGCHLSSMVDSSTGEVVGQMPMSSEGDCISGSWFIFDSPENYYPQIWRVQDGWNRVSYNFLEGCFHGPSIYRIHTWTRDEVNHSWMVQLPYILDQLKIAELEFSSFISDKNLQG
ncbi:hypothetical protein GYMLUDRAFT_830162 [Collybiopsis luxurians FD-317 M1]|uniref:Uncharacterized protein n=1 Tax=Collybiopsis luxurians FD-317 M1 TaxID=944289 RepID=A0A0D0BM24_9AGAR|nr:hypothetical protein GYMLUDRAFT_830162 [Collybiopsis luxurians FD-317 M1]